MAKFIINGGRPLKGEIKIGGMKNAITPILAATLLLEGDCLINNVPKIADVEIMTEILKSLKVDVEWVGEHQLKINTTKAIAENLNQELICQMRSSILLLGSMLSRFGQVVTVEPGGCIIGKRPLDTHLYALRKLGAQIDHQNDHYRLVAKELKGTIIILPEFSVTATENLIMAAVKARGKTIVKLAAAEPHVCDLINFLNQAGAKIKWLGNHILEIEGVENLKGIKYSIIPDQIEAGTFAVAAIACGGEVLIKNIIPEHLEIILLKFEEIGVKLEVWGNELKIYPSKTLKAFKVQALPYPGFPTDLQAPFGVLATQCSGTSLIFDPLFEGRLNYIDELIKMGANATICDPHRVLISGPTSLVGQEIKGLDLRAGATLIIAGLIAEGETIINGAEIIDRGYEKIEERLRGLGAEIRRVE